ncbi:unnamed protein product [Auanema sp. JU1783]|nr:unnamed protein product [Auanema sp. JU1783]
MRSSSALAAGPVNFLRLADMDLDTLEVVHSSVFEKILQIDDLLINRSVRTHENVFHRTAEVHDRSSFNAQLLRLRLQARAASMLAEFCHEGPPANAAEQNVLGQDHWKDLPPNRNEAVPGHLNVAHRTPDVDESCSMNMILFRLKKQVHAASILADVCHQGPPANENEQIALTEIERMLHSIQEVISPVSSLAGSGTESDSEAMM